MQRRGVQKTSIMAAWCLGCAALRVLYQKRTYSAFGLVGVVLVVIEVSMSRCIGSRGAALSGCTKRYVRLLSGGGGEGGGGGYEA